MVGIVIDNGEVSFLLTSVLAQLGEIHVYGVELVLRASANPDIDILVLGAGSVD